jgi:riboflavin kinase/FMN adenylyltransferase
MALPKFGVYIAKATVDEEGGYDAIVNVGMKPTVKNNRLSVEAHIRGIDEELYERYVSLSFERFLRAEKKFASVDELKEQIKEDAKQF